MLCEICHQREAEKQLNRVINGSVKTYKVCSQCFNIGNKAFVTEEKRCKFCGRKLSDINATLIVGCPHCYEQFSKELEPIIRQVQKL